MARIDSASSSSSSTSPLASDASDVPDASVARIVLVLKAPVAGAVKTRLAARLGPEGAVRLYRAMVETLIARLEGSCDAWRFDVAFAPDDAASEALVRGWLAPRLPASVRFHPQGEGDLGARMERAVARAFEEGCDRVALLGGDCIAPDRAIMSEAFERLEGDGADAFLGPATDGGYWTLGLSRRVADRAGIFFRDLPWSTSELADATRARAHAAGIAMIELARFSDVDTPEDLATLPPEMVRRADLDRVAPGCPGVRSSDGSSADADGERR